MRMMQRMTLIPNSLPKHLVGEIALSSELWNNIVHYRRGDVSSPSITNNMPVHETTLTLLQYSVYGTVCYG
jgi:hypothetical protein